ncbi:6-phospho-beta-glucosidase [Antricoccus suffuscus]|uniref:6-phospho-beta-glucosidase n=1 Tax=Antricoccus suffuscus TaxID=1629062 RepID=A0A2T1A6W3_9ACTN|nr:6-phospho-beta-glucosidase [Antricoccus suffuscus]PRZ44339.1 6-phospho-beta-glucosidase [Antricoccus suffuscus]
MQLTIIGGGGFRTPLVYRALLDDPTRLIDRVVLVDTDVRRLGVIESVLAGFAHGRPWSPRVVATTDLRSGLAGAAFVFSAIRPGGPEGREYDENIPLRHGVLGQETVGIGGILFALRSIPAMLDIARAVVDVAPEAWLINFTNPAGMVTEALHSVLGDRVIGICDSPASLVRRVGRALNIPVGQEKFDYVGLNHLGWLRSIRHDSGPDLLPALLADKPSLESFEEGQLFGSQLLRSLGCIPNEYLHYFYYAADVLASVSGTTSRASYLRAQQSDFYAAARANSSPASVWQSAVDERNRTYMAVSREAAGADERHPDDVEGGGYEQIALAVMRAIATNGDETLILNVRNAGAVPDLDNDAVVEIPTVVGKSGPIALPVGVLSDHQVGLMREIKAVERATIDAATTGSLGSAYAALAMHPLNGSFARATRILDEWLPHFPDVTVRLH